MRRRLPADAAVIPSSHSGCTSAPIVDEIRLHAVILADLDQTLQVGTVGRADDKNQLAEFQRLPLTAIWRFSVRIANVLRPVPGRESWGNLSSRDAPRYLWFHPNSGSSG